MHNSSEDAREAIKATQAGQKNAVWKHGRQVIVTRNVTGALFFTVGPIHGSEHVDEAVAMIEAVKDAHHDFYQTISQ